MRGAITPENLEWFESLMTQAAAELIKEGAPVYAVGVTEERTKTACGALVGYVMGGCFRLISLFVSPKYRRFGYANLLIGELVQTCREEGIGIEISFTGADAETEALTEFLEFWFFRKEKQTQPKLKKIAEEMGLVFFSSPFDLTAVDFLEEMDVPVYKVASFEINDIPFIRKIARTGKPIIMSTGIAYLADIELALRTCREEGNENVILLKCTSAYPAPYEDINLKTIPSMKEVFDCVVGLSDHTMGCAVAGAGVALGAKVVEKHLTLRRADGGADAAFSMEPEEFKEMVDHIRMIEKAVGKVTYDLTPKQKKSREHSRSLFVAQDMKAGDVFTPENLRSVRPSCGLHTKYYEELLGRRITRDAKLGTPMSWDLVDFTEKEQQ